MIKIPIIVTYALLTLSLCGFAFLGGYGLRYEQTLDLEAEQAALWVKASDIEEDIRLLRNGYGVLSAEAYRSGMRVPTFLLDLAQDTVVCTLEVDNPVTQQIQQLGGNE